MIQQRLFLSEGHELAVIEGNRHLSRSCVVFLHGILGSVNFWPALLPTDVRQSIWWLSISLPGHFPSCMSADEPPTEETFGQLLMQAIETQVGGAPVSLAGWSTGGFAALNLAACYPDRFERVMSIAGFAQGRWHGMMGLLQKIARGGSVSRALFRRLIRVAQASYFGYAGANAMCSADGTALTRSHLGQKLLTAVYPDFKQHSPESLCELFRCIRNFDITPRLGDISCRVTVIGGTVDSIIRWEHTQQIHAALRDSRLIEFTDCGHMLFAKQNLEFQQHLRDWLAADHRLRSAA